MCYNVNLQSHYKMIVETCQVATRNCLINSTGEIRGKN